MRALPIGLLLALTLPPFPLGPLAPLVLAPLLRGGFRAGFWAGVGFWALHLHWLPQSFYHLFGPLGALPYLPLVLLKGLLLGLLFAFTPHPLSRAGGWVVLEWLSAQGPLAFPWGYLGYALLEAPGRLLAALGGVYLLSLWVLGVAYLLWARRWGLALLLWLPLWALPLPPAEPPSHRALLVQGNVNPLRKALGELDEEVYLRLTQEGLRAHPEAGPVVWPETAVWRLPEGLDRVLEGRPLITGLNLPGPNRAVLYQGGEVLGQYDKTRLVPFGERFPFREALGGVYAFFFQSLGLGELGDREPGEEVRPIGPYGVQICYESAFPGVSRALAQRGAEVLVLLTNDAWFGASLGGVQHYALGRLRAVETGRWLLRAGNDGVTASIDPLGRPVAQLARGVEGYLLAPYAPRQGETPYVRFGDWAVGVALTLWAVGLILALRRPGWRNR